MAIFRACNEASLKPFINEKMDEMMNKLTRVISEQIGSLRA